MPVTESSGVSGVQARRTRLVERRWPVPFPRRSLRPESPGFAVKASTVVGGRPGSVPFPAFVRAHDPTRLGAVPAIYASTPWCCAGSGCGLRRGPRAADTSSSIGWRRLWTFAGAGSRADPKGRRPTRIPEFSRGCGPGAGQAAERRARMLLPSLDDQGLAALIGVGSPAPTRIRPGSSALRVRPVHRERGRRSRSDAVLFPCRAVTCQPAASSPAQAVPTGRA